MGCDNNLLKDSSNNKNKEKEMHSSNSNINDKSISKEKLLHLHLDHLDLLMKMWEKWDIHIYQENFAYV